MEMYKELLAGADPRAVVYPFMSSLLPSTASTALYLFVVLYAGPRFMRDRKAYDLKTAMVVYNFAMVVLSGWLFYEFMVSGWLFDYSLTCQEVDYDDTSPKQLRMVRVCYLYFISKHIEFLDTYFFILRKKTNQISFLHVFHHGGMAFGWWFAVNFSSGGLGTFHAPLNTFVHFIMYGYYGVAALGPRYQKYLGWKKYMTALQLGQLVITVAHILNVMLFCNCRYPTPLRYVVLLNTSTYVILFLNFWIQTYTKKTAKTPPTKSQARRRSLKAD